MMPVGAWLRSFLSLLVRDSRYMRTGVPYMARGPDQLTVPGGAMVFLFGEEDRDGMATVIYDGQVRKRTYLSTCSSSVTVWFDVFLSIYIVLKPSRT